VKETKEDHMRSKMKISGKGTIVTCFNIFAQTTLENYRWAKTPCGPLGTRIRVKWKSQHWTVTRSDEERRALVTSHICHLKCFMQAPSYFQHSVAPFKNRWRGTFHSLCI